MFVLGQSRRNRRRSNVSSIKRCLHLPWESRLVRKDVGQGDNVMDLCSLDLLMSNLVLVEQFCTFYCEIEKERELPNLKASEHVTIITWTSINKQIFVKEYCITLYLHDYMYS